MATKAERARAEQERSNKPPRPKQPKRPRRDTPIDTSLPGVSATDRRAGANGTARHNYVHRSTNSGGPALENSVSGRPSRKSTRKSAGHVKQATALTRQQQRKVSSPKERASRARAAARR